MRRDMDLVRDVLKAVADCEAGTLDAPVLASEERPFQLVAYHVDIMEQAGLVRANVQRSWGGSYVLARVDSLTWAGQDFLAAVSNDGLWAQAKLRVAKLAGEVSFETIKAVAVRLASDMLA
nr:MAG TPA: Transcriptional regulator, MarR/EmrR family, emrR, transcriptional regulator, DNA-binding [Caudoviricetes sp.]